MVQEKAISYNPMGVEGAGFPKKTLWQRPSLGKSSFPEWNHDTSYSVFDEILSEQVIKLEQEKEVLKQVELISGSDFGLLQVQRHELISAFWLA